MKQEKKSSPLSIIWSWAKAYHHQLVLSIFLEIIAIACSLIPYFCVINIIVFLFDGNKDFNTYLMLTFQAILGFIGKVIFSSVSTSISHTVAYKTLRDLRIKLVSKLTKLPMGTIIDTPTGVYKTIIVDKVEALEVPLAHLFPEMTANILIPLFIIIYLVILNPLMALLSLATVIISIVIMSLGMKGLVEKGNIAINTITNMTNSIIEYVSGIEVIKAFSMSAGSYQKYSNSVNESANFFIDWMQDSQKMMCTYNAILPSVFIGVLPVGLIMWDSGHLTTRTFMTTILFSIALVVSIMESFTFMNSLGIISNFTGEINMILKQKELIHSEQNVALKNSEIIFENVDFSYDQINKTLKNINLKIEKDHITALVGPSGSGKSTIAKLISSYWQVDKGTIFIGNHESKKIPLKQIANEISYVSQDNFLFNRSIMDNIRIGNQNASDDEVIQAAINCGCDEFIKKLQNGYETIVGSSGSHLSGGERQRIAIARAMLKNAPIVILDEATAYIDPENEAIIQDAIARLTKNKTLIVIAHRLSTIMHAHKIVVVNNGQIEAQGKHDELLEKCPLYFKMWQSHIGTIDKV